MKKITTLLWSLCVQYACWAGGLNEYKETRTILYQPTNKSYHLLQPGQSIETPVDFAQTETPNRFFIRVVGGVQMPGKFKSRGETLFRQSESYIDDNLDSVTVKKGPYSLYFKGNNDNFERHAYYRIPGIYFQSNETTIELPIVKSKNISVSPQGDLGLELELFYAKKGRNELDIYDKPDSVIFIPIPTGSKGYQVLNQKIKTTRKIACALMRIGGTHFSGECWVEAPKLKNAKGTAQVFHFTPHDKRTDKTNYWVGCNMATRSWPRWKIEYNNHIIFEGNLFDRASNIADFYVELPQNIAGNGTLKLTLVKENHRKAFPYEVRSVQLISETARDYEWISIPKYVAQGAKFGLLIETNRPHITLQVKAPQNITPSLQQVHFAQPGLHVISMQADSSSSNIEIEISDNKRSEKKSIKQIIEKGFDQVYLSSGDEVYVDKEYSPYNYFFKWYVAHRVGNWYQFRPSYQWSGHRVANSQFTTHYTHLLNRLNMPYAWQVEGRTLASKQINPNTEVLSSPMFKGKQSHENDGNYYYWQHFIYEGLYSDMAARNRPYGGIFAKHRPIATDHGTFIHYDTQNITSMEEGAQVLIDNLCYSKGESTRHTGPSTLFRYFYKAGYQWLGAEQMYGPEDVVMSALRGASRAYDRQSYGSLHAMQWGSYPFTDPKHALRMYLSFAVAYMHGSSHINTEEALWIDEYANDRYSKSGQEHLYAQHQMLDYIETHTRKGEQKSNVALIQGRNDGWKSFGRGSIWSQEGEKWKFNKAAESFDLLRVFYPQNRIDNCGPNNWFTETPYGSADLLPIEAPLPVMKKYKAIAFLGWNTFQESDFNNLRNFVFEGGTLLLTAAHINVESQPHLPPALPQKDDLLCSMLGQGYRNLTDRTVIPLGNGKIIYYPQTNYPIEKEIVNEYEQDLKQLGYTTAQEEESQAWVRSSKFIDFTVWDDNNYRTIYLLNTDWKSDTAAHPAHFVLCNHSFTIPVRRYQLETIHTAYNLAILPQANTTDILSISKLKDKWVIRVQTTDKDSIRIMNGQNGKENLMECTKAGIHTIIYPE